MSHSEEKIPGIERDQRISDEGLNRLRAHLENGAVISEVVLKMWVQRYGQAARELLLKYGRDV